EDAAVGLRPVLPREPAHAVRGLEGLREAPRNALGERARRAQGARIVRPAASARARLVLGALAVDAGARRHRAPPPVRWPRFFRGVSGAVSSVALASASSCFSIA